MYDPAKTNGETVSLWYSRLSGNTQASLAGDGPLTAPIVDVDVAVIGAGMAGLSVAYHLCQTARSVAVVDKGLIGSGETGRTTAHLSSALDDRYAEIERLRGEKAARLAAASHVAAIAAIEAIVATERIVCEYERIPGYLAAADDRSAVQAERELRREYDAARRAGLSVELLSGISTAWGSGWQLVFEQQAQFQPLDYLAGLTRAIQRHGGRIFTGTRAIGFESRGSSVQVKLEGGKTLRARDLVIATNTPVSDRLAMHTKQAAYRSYVLGMGLSGPVTPGLYWDTGDPYHYMRLAEGGRVMVVGGEDHKVGQSNEPAHAWSRLEAWARQHFPQAQAVHARWSGQIQEPFDGLAFIGKDPGSQHVFIATGDSGNGITHGAIAGLLLSELIQGHEHPWTELYEPRRKPRRRSLPTFVGENANVAVHFAQGLLQPSAAHRALPARGSGDVVRSGVQPVARYVSRSGAVHECSAICPHLGCIVQWNAAEESWDCPCHGSRFDPYGRVLTGPALRDLHQRTPTNSQTKETVVHRELLQQLGYEFWQTETSASRHCRREAERLRDAPPARALLGAARHADAVLAELPNFPLLRTRGQSGIGMAIGKLFSSARDTLADKLLTAERSYRGTLLGLRHGVDLGQLMLAAAEHADDEPLRNFLEQWLNQRIPLVEIVAGELHWFADRPEQALEQAKVPFLGKRPSSAAQGAS